MTAGFLGTRADIFVDIGLVCLVACPVLMGLAVRRASHGQYRKHRNLQLAVLVLGSGAVLLLEVSIRLGNTTEAFAVSAFAGTWAMVGVFGVHLAAAIPTFLLWLILAVVSWKGYRSRLPGGFSSRHRALGQFTFLGLCGTVATGLVLYVMGYVL